MGPRPSISSPPTPTPTVAPTVTPEPTPTGSTFQPSTVEPTVTPRPSISSPPTPFCFNDPDFLFDNDPTKNCAWVAMDLSQCDLIVGDAADDKKVMDFCRKTCMPGCA